MITTQQLQGILAETRGAYDFMKHEAGYYLPDREFASILWLTEIFITTKKVSNDNGSSHTNLYSAQSKKRSTSSVRHTSQAYASTRWLSSSRKTAMQTTC